MDTEGAARLPRPTETFVIYPPPSSPTLHQPANALSTSKNSSVARILVRAERYRSPERGYFRGLRWWSLVLSMGLWWSFIIALQYLLYRSRTQGGITFTVSVNRIPLRQTLYSRYLPTIISVFFSVFIIWIDNDVKRYEPHHQTSEPGGTHGRDSLLL